MPGSECQAAPLISTSQLSRISPRSWKNTARASLLPASPLFSPTRQRSRSSELEYHSDHEQGPLDPADERLHEEFKRRIKTQCMLPCADTACMLFWALMASGQITLRKVDGWKTLHLAPAEQLFDQAA